MKGSSVGKQRGTEVQGLLVKGVGHKPRQTVITTRMILMSPGGEGGWMGSAVLAGSRVGRDHGIRVVKMHGARVYICISSMCGG